MRKLLSWICATSGVATKSNARRSDLRISHPSRRRLELRCVRDQRTELAVVRDGETEELDEPLQRFGLSRHLFGGCRELLGGGSVALRHLVDLGERLVDLRDSGRLLVGGRG